MDEGWINYLGQVFSPTFSIYTTIRAQTKKLKPMFADLVACLFSNGLDQRVQVIAFKESHLSAVLAKQQMLMPVSR